MLEEEAVSKELAGADATRFRVIAALSRRQAGHTVRGERSMSANGQAGRGGLAKVDPSGEILEGVAKVRARVSVAGGRERPNGLQR